MAEITYYMEIALTGRLGDYRSLKDKIEQKKITSDYEPCKVQDFSQP